MAGEPIDHFLPDDEKEKEDVKNEIATKARTAGADVISLKGATFDGIAMSAFRIVESILKNQNTVLPVAHVLDESYGELAGSTISPSLRSEQRGYREDSEDFHDRGRAGAD